MDIDYTDTQLPDEELVEYLAVAALETAIQAEKERRRWEKARKFHFSGGMC